jgi:hypothetical protein
MNPKILSKGGKRMSEAIGCGNAQKSESVLGLLRYYEAILKRNGLVARIGEIRSLKLGLILDLLKMANIAEGLKDELSSSVVCAWEMNNNDNTLEEGEEEIKTMLNSIAVVRQRALILLHNCSPINLMQLDVTMMWTAPLIVDS